MRRISPNLLTLCKLATILLLLGAMGVAQTFNLTAKKMTATMPDGKVVPMWGFCDADHTDCSTQTQWTPGPTIVVTGSSFTVNLTNSLPAPTSFVILGQVNGGGVGNPNKVDGPVHLPQTTTTWPGNGAGTFTPPQQGKRVQSFGTETGVGSSNTYSWDKLAPGTYIYESGTQPSIQVPMGLYGVLIVTTAPTTDASTSTFTPGTAYPAGTNAAGNYNAIQYDADAVVLTSEVDAVQNAAVDLANGDASKYPAAVNYKPTYFLVNGKAFDTVSPNTVSVGATASTGNVLVRFANAGSRTHIPTVVGLPMSIVAEDGNVLPGNAKIQSEVLLTAGKTHDVVVKPASASGSFAAASFGIFDRALMLSNGNRPNGGLQAYLLVGGGSVPSAAAASAQAVNDTYVVALNSTTLSGNVLSNDIGVTSAALDAANGPQHGTVTINSDGTFTYKPTGATIVADSFKYIGNGSLSATVTLTLAALGGAPTANPDEFPASTIANYVKQPRPGVLGNDVDPTGFVLTAKADPANPLPSWVTLNEDGSFEANPPSDGSQFSYIAVNSQGTASTPTTVTLHFQAKSNLQVAFADALTKASLPSTDYRWMIEEDQTFHNSLDPNTAAGPANSLGTNFHHSYMNVVASGCTGPKSCNEGQTINGQSAPSYQRLTPDQVHLDPTKWYYISVLPGDGGDPATGAADNGHTMSGASIQPGQTKVTILLEQNPLPPAQLSIFVFEDNNPTNGDIDGPEEAQGLGGFNIVINDARGATGDPAGQMTYDAFNMPLTNALAQIRPDLCPITPVNPNDASTGLLGQVVTCPEKDIHGNPSPLAGHALIKNVSPGRYDVFVNPSAAREGAGENWIQVSTLEGTRANDAFTKAGEPPYFQEFGSPGFHAFVGFFNPAHVPHTGGNNTIKGRIVNQHMSRPSQVTLYNGSHEPLSASACYVGLNSNAGNGENVAFATCDDQGNFTLAGVAPGSYQIVVWDQWLDQIIDYHDITIPTNSANQTFPATTPSADCPYGCISELSWFTRLITRTFIDDGTHKASDNTPGVSQVPFTVRYRDGSFSNVSFSDSSGTATFAELFPLFNWYVIESDTTRYKGTAVHVVVDGGGTPDSTGPYAGTLSSKYPTGESTEKIYDGSDGNPVPLSFGYQGFISQTQITEWGKRPYDVGENGGIQGTVVYSSTRPFDDPRYLVQNLWEPLVPRVTVNLYLETMADDGSQLLKLVNTTKTSSWDDTAPSMSCPGQVASDPFVSQTLGSNLAKCYDGFHSWNQVQPGVYDGRYQFTTLANGTPLPAGKYVVEVVPPPGYDIVKEEDKNILIGDAWIAPEVQQFGALGNIFILPDQATLDNANTNIPDAAQGQACQLDSNGNPIPGTCVNVADNATTDLGMTNGGNAFPPCVGNPHLIPDYLTLFGAGDQGSGQVAPFAGAKRPLCDRKEVTLSDQMQATANFYLFTPVPGAAHFTGMILNDASAEFNPVNPDYGEKFAVPFVPVSIRDFNGVEINRVYSDQWGMFNGMAPSSWQVNVPTPAGYGPNMLITCMNDPGPIPDPTGATDPISGKVKMITDPAYNPMYSNFCYTLPFMPSTTVYLDTPVLPISAFASHYTRVDCAYPNASPAILRVDSSAGFGPYLPKAGGTLTITALGDMQVPNPDYEGPTATAAPYNQKTIPRHYGFGGTQGTVSINGVTLDPNNITSWTDASITVNVPANTTGGQLVVTAANSKQTVETVSVVVEDKAPTRVSASGSGDFQTIQDAIDHASPGDLILIDAGTYNELVIMDRPVRLQGVGANSVIINAAKYPTQKLDAWRPRINTLFGIDQDGNQTLPALVDPLPGQEITGGVVLLEPSVLGTEEGPGITVLAKNAPQGACNSHNTSNTNYLRNFNCASSRIDGISVTGGDAGGGIYVNGWAHGLEISNNRVYGNAGTMNGGIRIGVPYLEGLALDRATANNGLGFDKNVNLHNNAVNMNGMIEPTGGSIGAGGGITLSSGTDRYSVNYNYVCGNYSMGDGGGIAHIGYSSNGSITHNTILFNQSYQQSGNVHGGGIVVEGEPSTVGGQTMGTGNVSIDANLIQGNFAESGSGGGIRLQDVNGAERAFVRNGWLVQVTNNMVVNNVAGLAGGGISVRAANATIINNTVANNDAVAIVATNINANVSKPNPAGITTEAANGVISRPTIENNIVWQNRSFYFDATSGTPKVCASNGTTSGCTELVQTAVGQCATDSSNSSVYWDLGVVGDNNPSSGAIKLNPTYSVLTPSTFAIGAYAGLASHNKTTTNPAFQASYCNGTGNINVFKGFNASATIDEAGNYVDLRYGPLTMLNGASFFGDYHIQSGSPAIDAGTAGSGTGAAPKHDFDNDIRPQAHGYDIGADELQLFALSSTSLVFPDTQLGQTSASQQLILTNKTPGTLTLSFATTGNAADFVQVNGCGSSLGASASCTITVSFKPTAIGSRAANLNITVNGSVTTVTLSGTGRRQSMSVSPALYGFGNVRIGQSATHQFTITNNGVGPLTIASTSATGSGFSRTPAATCVGTLNVGASCVVTVSFAPTTTGFRLGALSVTSGGTGAALAGGSILNGTGVR